ncbi:MAG: phosphoribosylanthranilate isomerase [Gammaproteobacteria bacterium]|nr:phosphoribosylanthranilate isomerase [Gammaproteobacteria bacterium]MBT7370535.1 phosphoribosylanthranilate isomerase [Gammaproteobacteria bacterium]
MARTRIKICGITRGDDAAAAAACGVDAIGFNFYPGSARYVDPEDAMEIRRHLPAFVTCIGLFVDADSHEVAKISELLSLDLLQFHGNEGPDYCDAFNRPYIKAISAISGQEICIQSDRFPRASGVLLDTPSAGQFGGSGKIFDWEVVPELSMPVILAGGLNAENVGMAIRQVKPWAVDVSGGVESSKGIKDARLMEEFVEAVRDADGRSA